MSLGVQELAVALQTILTDGAEQAAKAAEFLRRRRRLRPVPPHLQRFSNGLQTAEEKGD